MPKSLIYLHSSYGYIIISIGAWYLITFFVAFATVLTQVAALSKPSVLVTQALLDSHKALMPLYLIY